MTRHVDPQVKAMLVARLREQRAAGTLTSAEVRAAAREIGIGIGIGERTLWRWLATTESPPRRRRRDRYEITEADRDACAEWHGNIAAVHRALHAGRAGAPSLRRLQAAFIRDLIPGERAAAAEGVEGRRRHEVHLSGAVKIVDRRSLSDSSYRNAQAVNRVTCPGPRSSPGCVGPARP